MKTYEAELTTGSWLEILGGKTSLYLDVSDSSPIGLCFWEGDAPAINAPMLMVKPNSGDFDFRVSGLAVGQKVYAKAIKETTQVVVIR